MLTQRSSLACIALIAAMGSQALADVTVTFREGAPKDRFTLANDGGCALGPIDVTIDLSGSDAGLIFDVTGDGAGVQVFQPFDVVSGADMLRAVPTVRDGDNAVTLPLTGLDAGQRVAFTIDVDDTRGTRAITVSRSEITGATIRVETERFSLEGAFDATAQAHVPLQGCLS